MAGTITQPTIDRARRLYETHRSCRIVADILHVSYTAIRLARKRGWKAGRRGQRCPQMPHDFPLLANRHTLKDLREHYRCGAGVMKQWLANVDRDFPHIRFNVAKPIPADARAVIRTLGTNLAAQHYGVSATLIAKWKRALGLPLRQTRRSRQGHKNWADRYFDPVKIDPKNRRAEHPVMPEPIRLIVAV